MKKVLLFTAKWPSVCSDTDGGSIMIAHLIDALKDKCLLDGLFLRKKTDEPIDGMNSIAFLNGDFLTYDTYKNKDGSKFTNRLENIAHMADMLSGLIEAYDKVIIIHCLQAMGLEELPPAHANKIILFPMFLSSSYLRSGDVVPEEYTMREGRILRSVGKIITPSYTEKRDIILDYGIRETNIRVIPRAVSEVFFDSRGRAADDGRINLLYIA